MYKLRETKESTNDVAEMAIYMITQFNNHKAASDFLDRYEEEINSLHTFPFGYRGISFEYRGYEIRLKPYDTYNVFFVVDTEKKEITVLRVLKDRQDWKTILSQQSEYHF